MSSYDYRGQAIVISDNDTEYKGYFEAAAEHRLVVKRCTDCGLLRGEPGPGLSLVRFPELGMAGGQRQGDHLQLPDPWPIPSSRPSATGPRSP